MAESLYVGVEGGRIIEEEDDMMMLLLVRAGRDKA